METRPDALLEDRDTARLALHPVRRDILAALRTPGSAASLAARLGLSRQTIGYHLRALEAAGLVRLVEERRRRGFTERIMAAAEAYVFDPGLLQPPADPDAIDKQDCHAAGHLIQTASAVVRDVARMQQAAEAEGSRLLTLTVEADLSFAEPADFDAFVEGLTEAVAAMARRYAAPGGRRYRLIAAAHPAVKPPVQPS
jgi:DNA-binding transcriptional ArsR family regulator